MMQEVSTDGAARAVLQPGDEILAIDGKLVTSLNFEALRQILVDASKWKVSTSSPIIFRKLPVHIEHTKNAPTTCSLASA